MCGVNNTAFRTAGKVSLLSTSAFGILALFQCSKQLPAGHIGVVDYF